MYKIKALNRVKAKVTIPADKSISHRAVILSALANGVTSIKPFLISDDTKATLKCIRSCGVKVNQKKNGELKVKGIGLYLKKDKKVNLFADQSGTTFRIFSGVLAGQRFPAYFDADQALRRRPMKRIAKPLRMMGANIKTRSKEGEEYPPFLIKPVKSLKGISR